MSSMTFGESLQRAQTAFRMGEYTLARRLLEKLLEQESDNPVVCNLLGSIYEREGEYEKAIGLFEKVLQARGDNIEAYNNLGVAYKNKGDTEKALAAFMKVLKLNERRADVYYNLGNLYKDLNQLKNAVSFYQKAIEYDPNYILAYNNLGTVLEKLGRHEDALQVYHKGLQIDAKNSRLHYNSGVIYKNKNRLKEAEAEFRLALRHQSGFTAAKNNLALILQTRREYERAVQLFHEILKADPLNAEAHNNLGVLLAEENILDGAREHYLAALKCNAGFRKARLNLALLNASTGSPEEALRELGRVLKEDPENAEALHQTGLLLLDQGKLDQAESHFLKILEREPENREALRALGRVHLKRGQIGPALKIRDRIQKIDRDNLDFSLDLAFYYQERREYAKAEEELRLYLSRHPRHPQTSVMLADILLVQKKFDAAQKALFDVLAGGKREPEILLMLAKVYKEKGLSEDALALLNEIITAQGASDEIREVKNLAETIKLYEETVTAYESQFKEQWDKNLKAYKATYAAPAREVIPAGDAMLFDQALGAEGDTVPIINIGGLEPVFEIKEEEEELKLEERDEVIEPAGEKPEKVVEIEDEGAPSLMSLLDGEPLYEESPQRSRERRVPREQRSGRKEERFDEEENIGEEERASSPGPPPPPPDQQPRYAPPPPPPPPDQQPRYAPPPPPPNQQPRYAPPPPPPPPADGAQGLDQHALDQLAGKLKESVESMGQAMKESFLSSALLAQQLKQQPPPPPVIMFTQPPITESDKKKEEPSSSPPHLKESSEAKREGVPRFIEEGETEKPETGEEAGGIEIEPEAVVAAEEPAEEIPLAGVEEPAEEVPIIGAESEEQAKAGETAEAPSNEDEVKIEVEPEDLGEPAEEPEKAPSLRDELRSYVNGVRQNLDEAAEEAAEANKPALKPLPLFAYLANISNYLPQEPRFQSLENEMRVKLEMMRSRLSGKQGLFQYIENSYPTRSVAENGGLTNEKLISTFSFIKNLSEFMPDPKLSMLLRRKIDGILGKIRGVSVK